MTGFHPSASQRAAADVRIPRSMVDDTFGAWALVFGIVSLSCCGLFAGIPAILLGRMSMKARRNGLVTNANLGRIGFIFGIIGTCLWIILWIVGHYMRSAMYPWL